MRGLISLGVFAGLVFVCGCNFNVPVDPSDLFQPIDNLIDDIDNTVDDLVTDPLNSNPYPVLVGGDNARVYYTTNIGDTRINFPGATNDIVIPGYVGPSNLYQFASRRRELIRPLIPTGSYFGLATDGQRIAYIAVTDSTEISKQLIVADVNSLESEVIFVQYLDDTTDNLGSGLALDDGRLVFVLSNSEQGSRLRIEDLTGIEPAIEIEADTFRDFKLRGDRLAYMVVSEAGTNDLLLRNLSTNETTVVALGLRVNYSNDARVELTDNFVVWSEPNFEDSDRVMAYNIVDGTTSVWADSVVGILAGANDEHFVTEEFVERYPDAANKYKVRRYDLNGSVRVLAEFRADGLAGQTTVIGDRAAWVNPERKVVLAPLAGGDRTIFEPF